MERISLSVLDRLIDDPDRPLEQQTYAQSVRTHKESVRRDLEWLLNTRRIADEPAETLREVNRSLYVYGLPDFTAYSIANPKDQGKLIRFLQAALKLFEPRLSNPRLVVVENTERNTRRLRFRIDAMLLMDPVPEHVTFDTVLQLTSGQYEVKDAG